MCLEVRQVSQNSSRTVARLLHVGARPDQRARRLAAAAGIDLSRIRASRVTQKELMLSDIILALDRANLRDLIEVCPPEQHYKISLLLSHIPDKHLEDVPDPYYGSYKGFEEIYYLLDSAVHSLVNVSGLFD